MRSEQEKRQSIKPELLGGFRDYLPEIMIPRQDIIANIRKTFESFGFLPLDTPALERSSVLGTDKKDFKMEVYRFSAEGQDVTLRFDLTVPLSRVVALHPEIIKPFKRYQFGSVWRLEKPQAGRFREFAQFDADIVGSDSILADTEIIVLMHETLKNLGIDRFLIKFNNRKILNGLPYVACFEENKAVGVFRILDKLDKIGLEDVVSELKREPDNRFDDTALALSDVSVSRILDFLNIPHSSIEGLREFFKGVNIAEEGVDECQEIINGLRAMGIPEGNWRFDLSIARGLWYYTGPVFETVLTDIREIGSVFSGGRYDELVMRFTGERLPATGASVGVDRLIAALEKLGKIDKKTCTAKVLFTTMRNYPAVKTMTLAHELRRLGINVEVYLDDRLLKEQIIYAVKRGIPYVAIVGEDEDRLGKIRLKDVQKREETLLTKEELIDRFISQLR